MIKDLCKNTDKQYRVFAKGMDRIWKNLDSQIIPQDHYDIEDRENDGVAIITLFLNQGKTEHSFVFTKEMVYYYTDYFLEDKFPFIQEFRDEVLECAIKYGKMDGDCMRFITEIKKLKTI